MSLSLATARAWPETNARALFRDRVEDFRVEEVLGFDPDGSGEHVFLELEKTNLNTEEVARRIARLAGVRQMDVGYSGMKDRRAVATQWFSIYLANRPEPDWRGLEAPDLRLLRVSRHRQKLRRGQHLGNRFEIRLRQLEGDWAGLESVLISLRDHGFPNYFGEQRFGIRGANLDRAENLFRGELRQRDRHKRSIYLSAARSWLFNQVLSRRVAQGNWYRLIEGDQALSIPHRDWEIMTDVPTGPLYGDAPVTTEGAAGEIEQAVAAEYPLFIEGLKSQRLRPERRALVAFPIGLTWSLEGQDLVLRFALGSGCFATAMLTECVELVSNWYESEKDSSGPDEQDGPANNGD